MVDEGAFAGSGLNEISLPGVRVIAENAFSSCENLWYVTLKATQIGNRAFANCKNLREVRLMDGTTIIGEQAFYSCAVLEHLRIPASVHGFGNQAFAKIPKLYANIPKQLEEHICQYRTCNPTYGSDQQYVFDRTAELHYY